MAGQSIYVLKLKRGPEALNRGSFEVSLSPLSGLLASPHRARLTLPRQESQFSSPKLSSRILAFTDEVVQWAEGPNASIITTPCPARQGGVGRESKHAIVRGGRTPGASVHISRCHRNCRSEATRL